MIPRFALFLLAAASLSAIGCGLTGESTLDAMKRHAKAQADANQEAEELAKKRVAKAGEAYAKAKGLSLSDPPDAIAVEQITGKAAKLPATEAPKEASKPLQNSHKTSAKGATDGQLAASRPSLPVAPEPPLTDIQRRNKSAENLDQIIKALNKHAREKGTYPTQASVSKRLGQPLLSWRVAILPYLGYSDFYREFKQDEPWDSPHNLSLLPHIPAIYVSPERCDEKTSYLAPYGAGTAWRGTLGTDPLSYADGADTTLVVVEADESAAVPWTKPEDLPIGEKFRSRLGHLRQDGFLAAFGNGYVALVHQKISDAQLSWMLSTDGDDYLADPTIIFDATVPDVALVSKDQPQSAEIQTSSSSDSPRSNDAIVTSGSSSAADRPVGKALPPVQLPTPPKKPERLTVPQEPDLAHARQRLRELYEPEYRRHGSPDHRRKLAEQMLAEAPRVEDDCGW